MARQGTGGQARPGRGTSAPQVTTVVGHVHLEMLLEAFSVGLGWITAQFSL